MIDWTKPVEFTCRDVRVRVVEVLENGNAILFWVDKYSEQHATVVTPTDSDLRNVLPKPKPREWWMNIYQGPWSQHPYATKADADAADHHNGDRRVECVHVREVLEEEE
jgi:hypothetical protein